MSGRLPTRASVVDVRGAEDYPVFAIMRIVAGLLVLYGHSYVLVGRSEPVMLSMGSYDISIGHVGVIVFFVLSGYLVTRSWTRKPIADAFALKRIARLWPAFALVTVFVSLVLGVWVTDLSVVDYLTGRQTWAYLFRSLTMSPIEYNLPGVFTDQPVSAVNGSLWTLPYTILADLAVMVFGLVGILRRRYLVVALTVGALVATRIVVQARVGQFDVAFDGVNAIAAINLSAWFLLGMSIYVLRDALRWTWPFALVVAFVGSLGYELHESLVVLPVVAYLLIYVGTRRSALAELIRRPGDPAYGIFLCGFPVQQTLIWTGFVGASFVLLTALSAPICLALGYVSWIVVEGPAMRWVRGLPDRIRRTMSRRSATAD